MRDSAPKTIPKSAKMIPNAPSEYMFHARIYPGKETPVAMGSPYEHSGSKGRVAGSGKSRPLMFESAKDPSAVRTSGFESFT
jgi:hypothetical protein